LGCAGLPSQPPTLLKSTTWPAWMHWVLGTKVETVLAGTSTGK
jgi:hypothetical protein